MQGGGRVYADFTSVHPYHGYPHHYFNATEAGLEWLMREVGGTDGTKHFAALRNYSVTGRHLIPSKVSFIGVRML